MFLCKNDSFKSRCTLLLSFIFSNYCFKSQPLFERDIETARDVVAFSVFSETQFDFQGLKLKYSAQRQQPYVIQPCCLLFKLFPFSKKLGNSLSNQS